MVLLYKPPEIPKWKVFTDVYLYKVTDDQVIYHGKHYNVWNEIKVLRENMNSIKINHGSYVFIDKYWDVGSTYGLTYNKIK